MKNGIPAGNERLEYGIRTLFRNGKSAQDVVRFLRRRGERYRKISVADVERFQVERVVDYVDGERFEHLPFTQPFADRIRLLLLVGDVTPEQILDYYRNKKGYSLLELRDIEYLSRGLPTQKPLHDEL